MHWQVGFSKGCWNTDVAEAVRSGVSDQGAGMDTTELQLKRAWSGCKNKLVTGGRRREEFEVAGLFPYDCAISDRRGCGAS